MARSTDKIIIVVKISGFEFSFIISLRYNQQGSSVKAIGYKNNGALTIKI